MLKDFGGLGIPLILGISTCVCYLPGLEDMKSKVVIKFGGNLLTINIELLVLTFFPLPMRLLLLLKVSCGLLLLLR